MTNRPKTATSFELTPGEYPRVDGDIFPWNIAREPIQVTASPTGLNQVHITLWVDGPVHIDGGNQNV